MVYLISRTVPEDLQPAVVVLAFAELPVVWAEIIGRPEEEVIGMLAEFFMTRDVEPQPNRPMRLSTGRPGKQVGL